MAGKDSLKPITHKNFKCEVDKEFVDVEDIGIQYLDTTTNLSPFRKEGSLVQTGALSYAQLNGTDLSVANLPNPGSDFELIDFYKFSVDRDEKEVTMLIFSNGTETKIYINPYYNPKTNFSNFNQVKTENTWIYEWFELTENYSATLNSKSGDGSYATPYKIVTNQNFTQVDHYFMGWFIVNTDLENSDHTKFNYVTDYDESSNEFTLKCSQGTWSTSDNLKLYRFPVVYNYMAETPSPNKPNYEGAGDTFYCNPTQFIYHQNELRIPCGEDSRPLILSMLFEKKFFLGDDSMSYDGFWFDFESIPQALFNSQVSAFADTTTGTYPELRIRTTDPWLVPSSDPSTNYIKVLFTGNTESVWSFHCFPYPTSAAMRADGYTVFAFDGTRHKLGIKVVGNQFTIVKNNSANAATLTELFDAITYMCPYAIPFTVTLVGTGTITSIASNDVRYFTLTPSTVINQAEANGNINAINLFLGTAVYTPTQAAGVGKNACPFIMTSLVDNRNEIILGHGRMFSNPSSSSGYPLATQVRFNTWFSRRLTALKFYHYADYVSDPAVAKVFGSSEYPYFKWDKSVGINNIPNDSTYDIYDFTKEPYGEITVASATTIDRTYGIRCYVFDKTNGFFFTKFAHPIQKLDSVPAGLTFITQCNRYIDEDTTMNYSRGCFVGETNGRLFIVRCKNTTQSEHFESRDLILYNNLCAGVSSYDTFSKIRNLSVFVGDKDTITDIKYVQGKLLVVKKLNTFAVDINTEDELRYRVVKTDIGRGCSNADSICLTPHGLVMPVEDSVYLVSQNGSRPLLRADNGKLNFYKHFFSSSNIQTAYYAAYDELHIVQIGAEKTGANYIMVYSFKYDAWTTLAYNNNLSGSEGLAFKRVRENSDKGIEYASVDSNSKYNILQFQESSIPSYRNVDGGLEYLQWELSTHYIPYGDKILDALLHAFTLHYDVLSATAKAIKLSIIRNGESASESYLGIPTTNNNLTFNEMLPMLSDSDQIKVKLSNLSNTGTVNSFTNFNINSFILWSTFQPRQLIQTRN